MTTDKITSAPWQTRPVFISSTFKDMQAERDYLRHVVFPRLEEELRKGRLLLEPIDLRQGVETADVDSEEQRELLVLKVCLEEIQRSRPFLIVLLGDRYGWVPPEERMAAATQEVGFEADVRDKSVTALEIEYGILRQSSEQRHRSFFYLRDSLPYSEMPEDVRADYSDEFSTDKQTRDRQGRLAVLKRSLEFDPNLKTRVHHYQAAWSHSTGKVTGLDAVGDNAFGEMVYQHLLGELQAEIAAATCQSPQTWEDQERSALTEFVEHRRRDFTGRQQLLDDLTNLARSESPPDAVFAIASNVTWGACVTGEPGSGKSAIFAELVSRISADDSILLLTNAAGATPRGSQIGSMLERFIQELAGALGIENPLPENASPDDVDATFASLLGRVAVKQRVVLLLDAINQFDETPRAQHVTWLRPRVWPANARIIATGLVGGATEALSQLAGIEELDIPPLTIGDDDTDDVTAIAKAVWQRYHRQANPAVLRVLKEKRLPDGTFAAGNPLWLTLALEQINLLDADDFTRAEREFPGSPGERLRALLVKTANDMPPTVAELYDLLLAQTERVFGVAPARAFAAVIAVSRFGWRESDLLALIPAAARILCPGEPVPRLDDLQLAALRRGFRAHLSRRGMLEQLDFFHAQMRQAVERRVLGDIERVRSLHRALADHLESLQIGDPLRDSELMVHLIAGDDPARAARIYADLPLSSPASSAATQVLATHILLGERLQPNVHADWVGSLVSRIDLSSPQVESIADKFNSDLFYVLKTSANIASRQTLLLAAQSALEQLIELDPANVTWLRILSMSIGNLGILAMAKANLAEALRLFEESSHILERLVLTDPNNAFWQHGLTASLVNLGDLNIAQGNIPDAQQHFGDVLLIGQRLAKSDPANAVWQQVLMVSFERLGDLEMSLGKLPEAKKHFDEFLRIAQKHTTLDPRNAQLQRGLSIALEKIGDLEIAQKDLPEAQTRFEDAIHIAQRLIVSDPSNTLNRRHLSVSLNKLGDLEMARANLPEAQRHFGEALRIRQCLAKADPANAGWQRDLSMSFEKLGDLKIAQGDLSEALRLFGESLSIAHRVASESTSAALIRDLLILCNKLRSLELAKGNSPEALRFFDESINVALQVAAHHARCQPDLSVSLDNLLDLNMAHEDLRETQRYVGVSPRDKDAALSAPASEVARLNSLAQEASDAEDRGETARAMTLYQEAEPLARQLGRLSQLQCIIGNIGNIHYSAGAAEKALSCYREQETLARQANYPDGLARSLYNQALVVSQGMGLHLEARKFANEALNLARINKIIDLQREIPQFLSWLEGQIHP